MIPPYDTSKQYPQGVNAEKCRVPIWDTVRNRVADKAIDMRKQGFFGAAMLPMAELEYTGITEKLKDLEKRFTIRSESVKKAA